MADVPSVLITLGPAIVGLTGVLVGAAISTGANYLLAVRKEKAEALKEKRDRAHEMKSAARLVLNEFMLASAAAKRLVRNKNWAPPSFTFPLDAWKEHKDLLAHELPLADWTPVHHAAMMVEDIRYLHAIPRPPGDAPEGLSLIVEPFSTALDEGVEALYPYTMDEIELLLASKKQGDHLARKP